MKYSVIIPAYNAENDILSCLKSISIQSFNDYEIIVINDGSTDSTLEVCADFKKKNANLHMIIKTVPNGGPGKARNEGLKMASGEKILFVDADDKVELNYFETLEKYNEKNYDFLCFGIIHHHQKKIRKGTEPFFLEGKNISSKFIDLYLGKGDLHSSVNKCFNKKFLIENNIFFPKELLLKKI